MNDELAQWRSFRILRTRYEMKTKEKGESDWNNDGRLIGAWWLGYMRHAMLQEYAKGPLATGPSISTRGEGATARL